MKLLTVDEVSRLLQAKPSTIYEWAETSKIPHLKVNGLLRFSEDDISRWLRDCQKMPAGSYNMPAGRRPRKGGKIPDGPV